MFSLNVSFCEKFGTTNMLSIKPSGPKAELCICKKIYTKETVSEKCLVWFFCDNILFFFLHLDNDQKGGKD